MFKINQYIKEKIEDRKQNDAFRQLIISPDLIDFASNDYLGLAKNEEIKKATEKLIKKAKLGATGSRLISGHSPLFEQTEKKITSFYKAEAALIFNSGYSANTGLLSCIPTRHDTIIYDQLIHASLRDGIRLSNAKSFSFKHNDLKHLKERLKSAKGNIFVVTESIFSMNGNHGKVKEINEISKNNQAALIVDEAHSTGINGDWGEGYCAELGLENEIFARIFTFGKAIGGHGAAVCGSKDLKDYLINFSRPFIYTTALPPSTLSHIKCSHDFLLNDNNLKAKLESNIAYFQNLAIKKGLHILPSKTAIQGILISGNKNIKEKEKQLQNSGYFVKAILHPTVEKGKERIRICLHSFNTKEEIRGLIAGLSTKESGQI